MSLNNVKVSVIIPVYNAEKYINRCLESVVSIRQANVEFVIINDGSTDGSLYVCQEMQKVDSRIRIYSQENAGVSAARNKGMDLANGEWITFVDADDEINGLVYDMVIERLETTTALWCVGCTDVDADRILKNTNTNLSIEIESIENGEIENIQLSLIEIDKKDIQIYKQRGIRFAEPWGKFYDKEILDKNKIRFQEKVKIGEDRIFNYQYMQQVDRIKYTVLNGYYYYYNVTSAMNCYTEGKKNVLLESIIAFRKLAPDKKYETAQYGMRLYLIALKVDFCHPNNTKKFSVRRREGLEFRNNIVINESFKHGHILKMRKAAIPIALMAKFRLFTICNLLLKVKAKLGIRV